MCLKRKYKIYHSKRRSLKIVSTWHAFPSYSDPLDDYSKTKPVLLTIKVPLSIAQMLAVKYDTCLTLNTIEGNLHNISVLEVYSRDMAEDLIQNYNSRVVVRK
jgi:hypothetical protein